MHPVLCGAAIVVHLITQILLLSICYKLLLMYAKNYQIWLRHFTFLDHTYILGVSYMCVILYFSAQTATSQKLVSLDSSMCYSKH